MLISMSIVQWDPSCFSFLHNQKQPEGLLLSFMFVGLSQVGGRYGGPFPLTVQLEKASLWWPRVRIGEGEEKAVWGPGGPELPLHLVSSPPSLHISYFKNKLG